MHIETIRMLYDYNYSLHRQVWDCIMHLTEEQFTQAIPYSIGSLHAHTVHVMSAEWIWFARLRGETPVAMLRPEDYPNRETVRARWDEIEQGIRGYLATLTDDAVQGTCAYRTTKGIAYEDPITGILLHVVNHGTDHRSQMLRVLHDLGAPTLEQDLIFYLRQRE